MRIFDDAGTWLLLDVPKDEKKGNIPHHDMTREEQRCNQELVSSFVQQAEASSNVHCPVALVHSNIPPRRISYLCHSRAMPRNMCQAVEHSKLQRQHSQMQH